MFVRELLMKVILLNAPESIIHKSVLDSKHLHVGLLKSTEEEQTTIPAKLVQHCSHLKLCWACQSLFLCTHFETVA